MADKVVKDASGVTRGYITGNGTIKDDSGITRGYITKDGTIKDDSGYTRGYVRGGGGGGGAFEGLIAGAVLIIGFAAVFSMLVGPIMALKLTFFGKSISKVWKIVGQVCCWLWGLGSIGYGYYVINSMLTSNGGNGYYPTTQDYAIAVGIFGGFALIQFLSLRGITKQAILPTA